MEDWTADAVEPKKFSQERLEGCDLCVLLVALRRGHIPEGETQSITQLEYAAAESLGLDTLVFLLDEEEPWQRKFDQSHVDKEIGRWRANLREQKGIEYFGTDPESIDISPALTRWIQAQRAGPPVPDGNDQSRLDWGVGVLTRRLEGLRTGRIDRLRIAAVLLMIVAVVSVIFSVAAEGTGVRMAGAPLVNGALILSLIALVPIFDYLTSRRHVQHALQLRDAMEADRDVGAVDTEWYVQQVKTLLSLRSGVTL